jgi:hypothetical protein
MLGRLRQGKEKMNIKEIYFYPREEKNKIARRPWRAISIRMEKLV